MSTNTRTHPCEHISVTIDGPWGTAHTTLDDWIKHGPGFRWLLGPVEPVCEDSQTPLPFSVIPLKYRNVALSRFLIATGVYDYPWERDKPEKHDIIKHIDAKQAVAMFTGTINIEYAPHIELGKYQINLVSEWRSSLVELFMHGGVLLTQFEETEVTQAIDALTFPLESAADVVMLVQLSSGSEPGGLEGLKPRFLPEPNGYAELVHHMFSVGGFESGGFSFRLKEPEVAVGVHLIALEVVGETVTHWAQVFYIAANIEHGTAACVSVIRHFDRQTEPNP